MGRDQELHHWQATVQVCLRPVNKYGDLLTQAQMIEYTVPIEGSLPQIALILERLKMPAPNLLPVVQADLDSFTVKER